jgi:hypothetical protein
LLPRVGDTLSDVVLYGPDGAAVRLSQIVTRTTLLVFLRHLA